MRDVKTAWNKIDLSGKRFGRLLIIKDSGKRRNKKVLWECKCDCGNTTLSMTNILNDGRKKSCGCLHKEQLINRCLKHGNSRSGNHSVEFDTWMNMKSRCYNKKNSHYKYYGAKGIRICKRWIHNFENFLDDMGKKHTSEHSIERINNNGNYSPSNCKWATRKEQARNKTTNRWFDYNGEKLLISELAKKLKCHSSANLQYFLDKGMTLDEIKNRKFPLTGKQALSIFSSIKSYTELSTEYNVSDSAISAIKTGQSWSRITGKIYMPNKKYEKAIS